MKFIKLRSIVGALVVVAGFAFFQAAQGTGDTTEHTATCQRTVNDVTLREDFRLLCPGRGLDDQGGEHWGITTVNYEPGANAPEGPAPYVSLNIDRIPDRCEVHVALHEFHHANFNSTDERAADEFALAHGGRRDCAVYL